jgi:hypothetical protein
MALHSNISYSMTINLSRKTLPYNASYSIRISHVPRLRAQVRRKSKKHERCVAAKSLNTCNLTVCISSFCVPLAVSLKQHTHNCSLTYAKQRLPHSPPTSLAFFWGQTFCRSYLSALDKGEWLCRVTAALITRVPYPVDSILGKHQSRSGIDGEAKLGCPCPELNLESLVF